MSTAALRLEQRRLQLIAQAARQRGQIATAVEPWRRPLAVVDRGLGALALIRRHPLLSFAAAALASTLATALPLHRGAAWLQRGLLLWRVARGLLT